MKRFAIILIIFIFIIFAIPIVFTKTSAVNTNETNENTIENKIEQVELQDYNYKPRSYPRSP